jgi:hypothetical protein
MVNPGPVWPKFPCAPVVITEIVFLPNFRTGGLGAPLTSQKGGCRRGTLKEGKEEGRNERREGWTGGGGQERVRYRKEEDGKGGREGGERKGGREGGREGIG